MKKISIFAGAVLALAMAASAQLKGIGYNGDFKQITGRLGLGANALDLGVGLRFNGADDNNDDNNFAFGLSGTFLGHLHEWGPVDTYFAAGALFQKLPQANDNIGINLFAGFQPEVTLMDHIAVATRLGLNIPVQPDVVVETFGSQISIVGGLNFTILF